MLQLYILLLQIFDILVNIILLNRKAVQAIIKGFLLVGRQSFGLLSNLLNLLIKLFILL
jgi:hypothetical protein